MTYEQDILHKMADHGWGRVTAREINDLVSFIRGHPTISFFLNDPDAHHTWIKLRDNGWAAIHPTDLSLFAMLILDEMKGVKHGARQVRDILGRIDCQ